MKEIKQSFCRSCINLCGIEVVVEDGVALEVRGSTHNPVYGGYTCIKGRSQTQFLGDPSRLLHPLRRRPDGTQERVSREGALADIAERLSRILETHGPRAIATYSGTMAMVTTAPTAMPMSQAFMDGIGSDMRFDPNTIDKGGKQTSQSFLGYWGAPSQGFDEPEAILLIGINPWVTHTGFPAGSPKRWLQDVLAGGCRLIVIDPRDTHVAQRADHHLQPRPGHDVALLAAIIKIVITEELYDRAFVADHVRGLPALTAAVTRVDVGEVARAADIRPDDFVAAARAYASAKRGYAMAGTGPNMAGSSTVLEYLVLVLETLCGRWLRAGEEVRASPTLLPTYRARAQAEDPDEDWAVPGLVRVRGLRPTRAGMPTAALADEILTPGDGQVRALISWGGNPAVAFPDQRRTVEALRALDLFVQVDPWLSESALLADYVVAPTLPLEVPSHTVFLDALSGRATGYGLAHSYAQYSPAIVDRPDGSDLVEEWEFFYELMVRMGLPLDVRPFGHPPGSPRVTLTQRPTTDELIELLTTGARVPLTTIKRAHRGDVYPADPIVVEPSDAGHAGRLQVGHPEMMTRLAEQLDGTSTTADPAYPFRLLCRREGNMYNTSRNHASTHRDRAYNPAYVHPDDLVALGLAEGARIDISSRTGTIPAFAHADRHLRRGVVSMAFGYGVADGRDVAVQDVGSSPSRLVSLDEMFDPYTGQPRMSNIPVALRAASD